MINERGIWMDKRETISHACDYVLCEAIAKTFSDVNTILDMGCGNGEYTKFLRSKGFGCIGFDGSPVTPEITNGMCSIMDFSVPQKIGKFDLVLSLEVGEHIPAPYEDIFIDNLCRASDKYICMSWAIEGQNGLGHFNCRNNDYVITKIENRGFHFDKEKSEFLRVNSSQVTFPWFINTLMVFYK